MDPQALKMIAKVQGDFTQELVDGWHQKDLKRIVEHLEVCFRNMFKGLQEKGYYFDGIERVSPLEFYNQITRPNPNGPKEFEIAKTSFFGVRIKNHFKDPKTGAILELKQPLIFLPFTNKHGDIYVRNSLYSLQFVLSERGPSVDGVKDKSIFSRVLGYKFKVIMDTHRFYRVEKYDDNVVRIPISMKLPANRFMSSRQDRRITSKNVPIPLLSWYLFGKYGFKKAMELYGSTEYIIKDEEYLIKHCRKEDGWEIYVNNDEIHQKAMYKGIPTFKEPGIALRSKSGGEINPLDMQYAAGLLFMFGTFAGDLQPELVDDPEYWRLIIGKCSINLSPNAPNESYLRQMTEHFISIEELVESTTLKRYQNFGIDVNDTFEYFNYLIVNYSNLLRTYNPADLLHKELASMEYLVENIIHSANDFRFKIRNKSNITVKIINRELDAHFKLFGIDKSIRENNTVLEQTGTDNPFIDGGLGMIIQTKSTINRAPGRKKDEFDPNHPGNQIDMSQPFTCSYQYATAKDPDARGMLIPRLFLIQGKYTAIRPEDRELYEAGKKRLEGN